MHRICLSVCLLLLTIDSAAAQPVPDGGPELPGLLILPFTCDGDAFGAHTGVALASIIANHPDLPEVARVVPLLELGRTEAGEGLPTVGRLGALARAHDVHYVFYALAQQIGEDSAIVSAWLYQRTDDGARMVAAAAAPVYELAGLYDSVLELAEEVLEEAVDGDRPEPPGPGPQPQIPEWAENPPVEIGMAVYATGRATFHNAATMRQAFASADTDARRSLAYVLSNMVGSAVTRYAEREGLELPSNDGSELNMVLQGCEIVSREVLGSPGSNVVYSLARMDYDPILELARQVLERAGGSPDADELREMLLVAHREMAGVHEEPEPEQRSGIPDWTINVPSEPGEAFYGTGTDMFRHASQMDRAFRGADASARRQIADVMKTTILAAATRYTRQVLSDENQVHVERLAQDVTRAITNWVLMSSAIIKREVHQGPDTGDTTVYALSCIRFDAVVENLQREVARAIARVQDADHHSPDDLRLILEEEHERHLPHSPLPD